MKDKAGNRAAGMAGTIQISLNYPGAAMAPGNSDERISLAARAFRCFIKELRKLELLDAETLTDIDFIVTDYLCHANTSFIDSITGGH